MIVYFNLHKKCLSIQHKALVVAHLSKITLSVVTFKVSEAGRQRVLAEKRKNVHAFICGTVQGIQEVQGDQITYNPYKYASFVRKGDETPIKSADMVTLNGIVIHAN